MISDNDLYSLAIFLGSLAMLLIVVYHFLEINANKSEDDEGEKLSKGDIKTLLSPPSVDRKEDEAQKGGRQAVGAAGRGGGSKGGVARG